MATKGTQVPTYTNAHCFCIFLIFQNFFFYFIKKQNKVKLKSKQTKNMLNNVMHKTKLTQNKKPKQTSNA